MKADYTLYLVTDRRCLCGRTLPEAVEQAALGGCTMVQLREHSTNDRELFQMAAEVKEVTDRYKIPLIINNRPDIALAVQAAGVHIGQSDLPAASVRKMLGMDKLLGVSASTEEEAVRAWKDGADYLGVGAMFPSKTKPDAGLVSLEELGRIRRAVPLPMVVIGGISRKNAPQFREIKIDGVAVVSAIMAQKDIAGAAREIRSIL